MSFTKAFCISHGEDSDGLICVALLRRIKDVSYNLVTYDDFEMALASLKPPTKELYICDLNIRKALVKEIKRVNRFAKIFVFDHHPTVEGVLQNLREAGVEVIHDTKDCASVLLYDYYKNELGFEAGRLAAYAAWSDQFEDGPIASKLIRNYDRQLVQHEALILTHTLAQEQTEAFKNVVI